MVVEIHDLNVGEIFGKDYLAVVPYLVVCYSEIVDYDLLVVSKDKVHVEG